VIARRAHLNAQCLNELFGEEVITTHVPILKLAPALLYGWRMHRRLRRNDLRQCLNALRDHETTVDPSATLWQARKILCVIKAISDVGREGTCLPENVFLLAVLRHLGYPARIVLAKNQAPSPRSKVPFHAWCEMMVEPINTSIGNDGS